MRAPSHPHGLLSLFLITALAFAAPSCSSDSSGGGTTGDTADGAVGFPDADGGGGGDPDGFVKPDGGPGPQDGADGSEPPADVPVGGQDVAPREDGAGGRPFVDFCTTNEECASGFCVQGPEGGVCTATCLADCPEGWGCQGVINVIPDVVFICVPLSLPLCQSCQQDAQCGDGRCVQLNGASHCLPSCDDAGNCGPGFTCDDDAAEPTCVPTTGSCTCRLPEHEGRQETCEVTNATGTCFGVATCDPAVGWQDCDAQVPAEETCNGADDDCNGLLDDGLEDTPCTEEVAGVGTCTGTERCLGVRGLVCDAPTPEAETCDFRDNDCDGETDEPFKVDGAYGTDDHCGSCNASCEDVLPNATAVCDPARTPPRCVVAECDPGYTRLNEFQCILEGAGLCEPCESDETCLFEDGRCVDLGFGRFCAKPCSEALPCPESFECTDVGGGDMQCTPVSGSCTCNESTVGQRRDCSTTWTDPADPDSPVVTCFGYQLCEEAGWSLCVLPTEACDSVDNDCNGVIDEDFRDEATGLYLQDANCGQCGNNCGFLEFANGVGICSLAGGLPRCVMECEEGFLDVDENPATGCECAVLAGPDVPDGIDTNCDGVDGDVSLAVFVSKDGDDTATGTIDDPVRSVGGAITLADDEGKRDVYVATGLYEESVSLVAGVHVYGGYSADFRVREPLVYETTLFGAEGGDAGEPGTVNAIDLGGAETTLDGFTVFGVSGFEAGESSVAIYLRDVGAGTRITNNRVIAGNGADGGRGTDGGDGDAGEAGTDGAAPVDVGAETCSGQTAGGGGGPQTCGAEDVSGGAGGAAVCPDYDESVSGPDPIWSSPFDQTQAAVESGSAGAGPGGAGGGGQAGYDTLLYSVVGGCDVCQSPTTAIGEPFLPHDGADGGAGTAGADGDAGGGCADGDGAFVDGVWTGGPGTAGTAGAHGAGGGGGGAGGGVETLDCAAAGEPEVGTHDRGGSGGGGGSGGCAAEGGGGGAAGGASFGVVLVYTGAAAALPDVSGNTIFTGRGGRGGDGGNGGRGGAAGDGGAGGPADPTDDLIWCAGEGGRGGRGGSGGHGGGGGGGCGGVSFGLYVDGAGGLPLTALESNTVELRGTGGAGGAGGASLGLSGAAGTTGAAGARNF